MVGHPRTLTFKGGYKTPADRQIDSGDLTSVVSAEDYGAVGDGVADDTAALQAALNQNTFVELLPGKTYLVTNLSIPHIAPRGGILPKVGIICRSGTSTIKAKSGGDAAYLIAHQTWINNNAYANFPSQFENIEFDGASIVQDVFCNTSYGSMFSNCRFNNGLRYGHAEYGVTRNGTTSIANTLPNNQYLRCGAFSNGSHGMYNDGKATDSQIIGGYYANNGGWQIYYIQTAGLLITGVHTYSANNQSLYLDRYGFNSSVTTSIFEGAVTIQGMNTTTHGGTFGPGNTIGGLLTAQFADNNNYSTLRSLGNTYLNLGGTGQIKNNFNGNAHTVISDGDTFQTNTPFLWNGATTAGGRIIAKNVWTYGNQFGTVAPLLFDGLQIPSAGSGAPNELNHLKFLSNSGTTTTFTVSATVLNFAPAGLTIDGTLDVWSTNSDGTALENYTCRIRAHYYRSQGTGLSVKKATILDADSTGVNVSAAIAILDTIVAGGNNTVTITVTITHPQAPDQYSSAAQIKLNARSRSVSALGIA